MVNEFKVADDDAHPNEAIRRRDKHFFEMLYKKHFKGLYTLSYRYTGRPDIAEEMVHDVFMAIWNKADTIQIESSMKSYLIRSVINASLNYINKEKNDSKKKEAYAASRGVDEETLELYDEQENMLKRLESALELLPPQCKRVMMMSRFDKMKQQEIAESLNISVKTVKNHLTYGFSKLRQALLRIPVLLIFMILLSK